MSDRPADASRQAALDIYMAAITEQERARAWGHLCELGMVIGAVPRRTHRSATVVPINRRRTVRKPTLQVVTAMPTLAEGIAFLDSKCAQAELARREAESDGDPSRIERETARAEAYATVLAFFAGGLKVG